MEGKNTSKQDRSDFDVGKIIKEDVSVFFSPVVAVAGLLASLIRSSRGPKAPTP